MTKIFIATYPFSSINPKPLELLKTQNVDLVWNPLKRRLKEDDLCLLIGPDIHAVIAGTEPYNAKTLKNATNLKVISRVGIGLDSVDLAYCRQANIQVTYTPDAPSDGVAELTVANILGLVRHIQESDRSVRSGTWNRHMGRLLREMTIGIVGVGRIGSRVIRLLDAFQPKTIAYDSDQEVQTRSDFVGVEWTTFENLLRESDLVTIHIPLNDENRGLFNADVFSAMKNGAFFINTSRGLIVDEKALENALYSGKIAGAALDVFVKEPYRGSLISFDNVILTAHIAASTVESRYKMELGAAEDCLRVLSGHLPLQPASKY